MHIDYKVRKKPIATSAVVIEVRNIVNTDELAAKIRPLIGIA